MRSVVIDMILATEMTRHFEHLAKFVSIFGSDEEPKDVSNIKYIPSSNCLKLFTLSLTYAIDCTIGGGELHSYTPHDDQSG